MIFMPDDGYFLTFPSMLYKNVSVIWVFFCFFFQEKETFGTKWLMWIDLSFPFKYKFKNCKHQMYYMYMSIILCRFRNVLKTQWWSSSRVMRQDLLLKGMCQFWKHSNRTEKGKRSTAPCVWYVVPVNKLRNLCPLKKELTNLWAVANYGLNYRIQITFLLSDPWTKYMSQLMMLMLCSTIAVATKGPPTKSTYHEPEKKQSAVFFNWYRCGLPENKVDPHSFW